jgi:uncharacterized protein YndB with AHSA1/START domain
VEGSVKILLLVLGILVGLLVVITVIGALLPREHTASRQAAYRRPAAELYAAVRDIAALPQWRTGLKSAESLPPEEGRARFREVSGHGPVTYRVLEDRPGERLVLEIADLDLPYGGTWTFAFSRTGEGAALRITENGFVKNPLFRFLARFVFGHTSTMETYLRDLGRKFGETVQPQP